MSVSIKDIARQAGVSHSTVSRALADSPLVSATTKKRIQRLAQEMGYTPSAIARAMSTHKTQTVGLVVTSIADPFVAEVVSGIEETALDHGYTVILCNSTGDPEREIAAVRALREKWVDAVIVTASRVGSFYAQLAEIRVPVVLINNQQQRDYTYSVSNDDLRGGEIAGRYLLDLGHRTIAYITGPESAVSSELRLRGCRQALATAEVSIAEQHIVPGDGQPEGARSAVRAVLQAEPLPTAIFCYNDMTAMGAMRELKEAGLRVPQDISIVGYDDVPTAAYLDPPLTTVRQAKYTLGQKAMQMTLSLLQGKREIHDVLLLPQLTVRSSCDRPRLG